MKNEGVLIILLFLLSFTFLRALSLPITGASGPIRVPQDFSTIQQAIDASASGATILIEAGVYNENITVWKPLVIKGKSTDSTIIEQAGAFAVCHVTANNVNISGFTLKDGSIGLWIDSCNYNSVTSIIVTNNEDGMWVTSSHGSIISSSILTDNLFMGLYLEASDSTSIDSNTVAGNTYGIYAQNSEYNTIHGNNISLNYADGIDAINNNYSAIYHNLISNNSLGIYLEGSNGNSIYENNLVDNIDQVWAESTTTNSWDDGSHGNYWSNYAGVDTNGDGIGDTPHVINGNNQDRYPLMNPWINIAVADVLPSKSNVGEGYRLYISVTVQNQGWNAQTTNLTVYVNTTVVGTVASLALPERSQAILNFTWQTTPALKGNYVLSSTVDPIPNEPDVRDNNKTYGRIVKVTVVGDVNGDGAVDIFDAITLSNAFASVPNSPTWNGNVDINSDNSVDIFDAILLSGNFGKKI